MKLKIERAWAYVAEMALVLVWLLGLGIMTGLLVWMH